MVVPVAPVVPMATVVTAGLVARVQMVLMGVMAPPWLLMAHLVAWVALVVTAV